MLVVDYDLNGRILYSCGSWFAGDTVSGVIHGSFFMLST